MNVAKSRLSRRTDVKNLLLLLFAFALVSCASAPKEAEKTAPNITATVIGPNRIEVVGTESLQRIEVIDSIYLILPYDFSITINIGGKEYGFKYDKVYANGNIKKYIAVDENGKKLSLKGVHKFYIDLWSSYYYGGQATRLEFEGMDGVVIGTSIELTRDGETFSFGRKKPPYNCVINIDSLLLFNKEQQKRARRQQEKNRLAEKIICKKFGFTDATEIQDFKTSRFKSSSNFLVQLMLGDYGKAVQYSPDDYIVFERYTLQILDVERNGGGYVYLMTAYGASLSVAKACMVHSPSEIEYISLNGAVNRNQLILSYVGKSQYQRGYTYTDCDVFEVRTEDNDAVLKTLIDTLIDIERIEEDPYKYEYVLSE